MMILALVSATAIDPASPPGGEGRSLICAAAADGDTALAKRIAALVAKTQPEGAGELPSLIAAIEATGRCPGIEAAPKALPPELAKIANVPIKGSLEFGLGQTSGTTDAANANIAVGLEETRGRWSQKLRATLDYQDIEGIAAAERYTANWDVKRSFWKNAFITGLATFERDRLAGFHARTTQSIGFGAKVPLGAKLALDLSGGPSWRQVDWNDARGEETLFGARGSAAVSWAIAPGVNFAASGSGIFEADSGTLEGQASLTGKLIGPLATRLQFVARHETKAYPGVEPTTTSSRASIVYSF